MVQKCDFHKRATVRWAILALALVCSGSAVAQEKRVLDFSDLAAIRDVSDPQVSPEGEWVAYVVRASDVEKDEITGDIWMTSWDGQQTLQLTHADSSESLPRFSPDGKYLAFLASRESNNEDEGEEKSQVWLLARAGGEARKLTDYAGGVEDYAWAPDSKRLAVIASDPDPDDVPPDAEGKEKTPKPIVVDRYQFKEDEAGYLRRLRDHLYLFDLETGASQLLTPGDFDEALPSWSPDGSLIAFFSKRDGDPDRNDNQDLYLIEPKAGATPRKLTTFPGDDGMGTPASFSPDGKSIAYLRGTAPEYTFYDQGQLAVIPLAGGEPRLVLGDLDRAVWSPQWSADGYSITFLLEDDRNQVVARVAVSGGPVERLAPGQGVVRELHVSAGRTAVVMTTPEAPAEVMALEGNSLRPLSAQNEKLLAGIEADWGHLEVQDVLATIDHVVAAGIADPDRLGIGGWSYGGMTTNYTIATDTRFKAAVSGAGISNILAGYGTDQYVRQYENEIGLPWEHLERYLHVSFPFFHADRIRTPTLFLCGEKDFNVPLLNSEQMYQALKSLGLDTRLVIYPGQYHGLTKPSYQRDRLERYVAWFDRFLK
jgi:dipeptidyl aminopeptidase/acylaminoacyl peptidase